MAPRAPRLCPACGASLLLGTAAEVVLAHCERCGGQWLDNDACQRLTLARFTEHAKRTLRLASTSIASRADAEARGSYRQPAARERRCPVCSTPLVERKVGASGVRVDVCPAHGTWFDPVELDQLLRLFEQATAISAAAAQHQARVYAEADAVQLKERVLAEALHAFDDPEIRSLRRRVQKLGSR